jgi:hypothetical protein
MSGTVYLPLPNLLLIIINFFYYAIVLKKTCIFAPLLLNFTEITNKMIVCNNITIDAIRTLPAEIRFFVSPRLVAFPATRRGTQRIFPANFFRPLDFFMPLNLFISNILLLSLSLSLSLSHRAAYTSINITRVRASRYAFFSFPEKNAPCKFIAEMTGRRHGVQTFAQPLYARAGRVSVQPDCAGTPAFPTNCKLIIIN